MNGEEEQLLIGGDALHQAAENRFGRSLTPAEWQAIEPERWSSWPGIPYGQADLDELLSAMAKLPTPPQPSATERQRAQALASRRRTAAEAKEFVERERTQLFGAPGPPFENDFAAAAAWIEAQETLSKTSLLALSVVTPAGLDDIGQLSWLRDWLGEVLPDEPPHSPEERRAVFSSLLKGEASAIRRIGREAPLLDYLAPMPRHKVGIKPVPVDDNTVLDNLRCAADRLAHATGWSQVTAVHHILTGGMTSTPVIAMAHNRWGRESFGGPKISLEILDPFGVSAEEVARAYVAARKGIIAPDRSPPRRARVSVKRERLVAMAEETPTLTWPERWVLWNSRYPGERFPTGEAMRRAYGRARRR